MDPQTPLTPVQNHNPMPPKTATTKTKTLQYALIATGVVAVILFVLVIVYAVQANNANAKAQTAQQDGQKQGAEAQKAVDDKKIAEDKVSDTRTYYAPDFAGSFSIAIPKVWSLSTTPNDSGSTISGISNPDLIDTKADKYALRFGLRNQTYSQMKNTLDQQTKQKNSAGKTSLSSTPATVSGVEGTRYTGQISNKVPNGTIIIVPIRDKTFTIETDDNAVYSSVFNTIVASVKLNP
jgi:hypothetical protein